MQEDDLTDSEEEGEEVRRDNFPEVENRESRRDMDCSEEESEDCFGPASLLGLHLSLEELKHLRAVQVFRISNLHQSLTLVVRCPSSD